jgi:hypothetical protein
VLPASESPSVPFAAWLRKFLWEFLGPRVPCTAWLRGLGCSLCRLAPRVPMFLQLPSSSCAAGRGANWANEGRSVIERRGACRVFLAPPGSACSLLVLHARAWLRAFLCSYCCLSPPGSACFPSRPPFKGPFVLPGGLAGPADVAEQWRCCFSTCRRPLASRHVHAPSISCQSWTCDFGCCHHCVRAGMSGSEDEQLPVGIDASFSSSQHGDADGAASGGPASKPVCKTCKKEYSSGYFKRHVCKGSGVGAPAGPATPQAPPQTQAPHTPQVKRNNGDGDGFYCSQTKPLRVSWAL